VAGSSVSCPHAVLSTTHGRNWEIKGYSNGYHIAYLGTHPVPGVKGCPSGGRGRQRPPPSSESKGVRDQAGSARLAVRAIVRMPSWKGPSNSSARSGRSPS
jgi:hypothetical protein